MIASSLFALSMMFAGRILIRGAQRLQRVKAGASHLLPGKIVLEIPGPKGARSYVYGFTNPDNNEVRGTIAVGARVRFPNAALVAVLYADDKTHSLL